MTYPPYVRDKARKLRSERKLTIDEIAERLAVSRTTVYSWVRDLPIAESPAAREGRANGRRRAAARNREIHAARRAAAFDEGWSEYPELSAQPAFRDFVCLYMAEGSKRCRNVVALCNSDPAIVTLANHWIGQFADNRVRYWLQYHADQDLADLQRFWAGVVGTAPEEIRHQRKSNSGQLNGRSWRSVHGVLTVRATDTRLRMRLEAWMQRTRDSWLDSRPSGV